MRTLSVTINSFSFTIDGLKISFNQDNVRTLVSFDPSSTCDLFKNIGFIEDFTTDQNGEPVILFIDNNLPRGYGYELWCQFVESFPKSPQLIRTIIEWRNERTAQAQFHKTIDYLLRPVHEFAA